MPRDRVDALDVFEQMNIPKRLVEDTDLAESAVQAVDQLLPSPPAVPYDFTRDVVSSGIASESLTQAQTAVDALQQALPTVDGFKQAAAVADRTHDWTGAVEAFEQLPNPSRSSPYDFTRDAVTSAIQQTGLSFAVADALEQAVRVGSDIDGSLEGLRGSYEIDCDVLPVEPEEPAAAAIRDEFWREREERERESRRWLPKRREFVIIALYLTATSAVQLALQVFILD